MDEVVEPVLQTLAQPVDGGRGHAPAGSRYKRGGDGTAAGKRPVYIAVVILLVIVMAITVRAAVRHCKKCSCGSCAGCVAAMTAYRGAIATAAH
jgi:hypothetical protein